MPTLMGADVIVALRSFRRALGPAVVAMLCLAVGIGAVTTMAEVVDLLLLRPPPRIRAPREVVQLHFDWLIPGATGHMTSMVGQGVVYAHYLGLRENLRSLRPVAGYHVAELSLGRGAEARPVTAAFVTGSFFPLLGVQPEVGNLIAADGQGGDDATAVAVISHRLWRSHFGGDPSVLGRRIRVGKGTYTVVGVTATGFQGVEVLHPMDIWLPIGAAEHELFDDNHQAFYSQSEGLVQVIGRLAPGTLPPSVTAEAAAFLQATYESVFGDRFRGVRAVATVTPIIPGLAGERSTDGSVGLWLTAVATLVLLIACANVAGLLLVRGASRRREVAIRFALGATRLRVARLFLADGLILAAFGGALGVALREWGGHVVRAFLLPQLDISYNPFDARMLVVAAVVTLATGLACGIIPALLPWDGDVARSVSGAARVGPPRQRRLQGGLLVAQVALAMTLVSGAALFVSSWRNVAAIKLGFVPENVLVGRMSLPEMGYATQDTRAMFDRMAEHVLALPGVRTVSVASGAPFVTLGQTQLAIPGLDLAARGQTPGRPVKAQWAAVSPSFFVASGVPVVRGRSFEDGDRAGTERVAIINEKLARTFWPATDPIGQCVQIRMFGPMTPDLPCTRVVGVAGDTRAKGIRADPDLQIYSSLLQREDIAPVAILVRTEVKPLTLVSSVRLAMQGASGDLPFADVRTWGSYLEPETRPWRLGASVFTVFGILALGLAAAGLYGVFSFVVSRRAPELAIRAVLGARSRELLGLVLREGLRLAAVGIAVGAGLALIIGRVSRALLVGVSGSSPLVLGGAAVVVVGVAMLAVVLPARRAAGTDPAVVLREE